MRLHKLSAGSGYTYLTSQVAANDATDRGIGDLDAYYSERGETPGEWLGHGLTSVPQFDATLVTEAQMRSLFGEGRHPDAQRLADDLRGKGAAEEEIDRGTRLGSPYRIYERPAEFHRRCAAAFREHNAAQGLSPRAAVAAEQRAAIRTRTASTMFAERHGRPPADARELTGHLARVSRPASSAVAGYDLTFSPVKSVSVLWAIAPRAIAAVIEQAHADAVADVVGWLEDHAAYTRRGHGGVAQVDVTGLIAAAFTHRDSRNGDPDLHTHVVISNKVQALDGTWLALDGRPLHECAVAASERYNTRLETQLSERLGVTFAERTGAGTVRSTVREVVGVEGELPRRWSSRRVDIEARRATLIARFQAEHGRVPTPNEAAWLGQQATLETRPDKHAPRAHAEQRATWRAEALEVLGGAEQLAAYVRRALNHEPRLPASVTAGWITGTAREVVTSIAATRATWQEHHLRAEAERRVRRTGLTPGGVDAAVDAVVASCVEQSVRLEGASAVEPGVEPWALRRRDGTSVFVTAGSTRYTSREVLAAEQTVLAAAELGNGRTVSSVRIARLLERCTADGQSLYPGQRGLVRQLAASGARVQLALAPAGTGKTTALHALARVWKASGGSVLGLAPSAAAAALLREELDAPTDTLAKATHTLNAGAPLPRWLAECGPATLLIVDEAGMAATTDLAASAAFVIARGGSVRLIGDDSQLAAVGAGGLLRDLAERHGAATLTEPLRFRHPADGALNRSEGAASLALRAGDPAALGFYLDHGRVHVAAAGTVAEDAYAAWTADRAAGRDALLLAPTRELVTELNARARQDRVTSRSAPVGRTVVLADGLPASPGDVVLTKRNDRRLHATDHGGRCAAHWVRNGDRWIVRAVTVTGDLVVSHVRTGTRARLPQQYVREHVALGYATTVHAAQGLTADTCHTVVTGTEGRRALYVAMTRGRYANHVYLQLGTGDPHAPITPDAIVPLTAGEVLARMLARNEATSSATSQLRDISAPGPRLTAATRRYTHALHTAAEDLLGPAGVAALDRLGESVRVGLTECPAWPGLRFHLAVAALEGRDPAVLLAQAAAARDLGDARDPAAVVQWRMGVENSPPGPLPWLDPVPDVLADAPVWGPYLKHRMGAVQTAVTAVRAGTQAGEHARTPQWLPAVGGRGDDPALAADLAVWRAAHDVGPADHRPTGPPQTTARAARAQADLQRRVDRALGRPGPARWTALAAAVDRRLTGDPYWPVVADRLQRLGDATETARLLARAARGRPLPDEHAAAALWWRLCGQLAPDELERATAPRADDRPALGAGPTTGSPARPPASQGQHRPARPRYALHRPARPRPSGRSLRDRATHLRPVLTDVAAAHRPSRREPPTPPR